MQNLDHKKQLHTLVDERHALLKLSLTSLADDQKTSDRARALEESIAALQTHVSGGWEKVGEQEAAALVRWLEQSKFLFDAPNPETTAATLQLAPLVLPLS